MNPTKHADFRSDTVTRPSPAMLEAMMQAEVGDDTYGGDPTVNALQEAIADRLGMEASLFCVSGTMANQVAVRAHCTPGSEVILDEGSHLLSYEGGATALAGLQTRPIPSSDGLFAVDALASRIRKATRHTPPTGLVCLENTHNLAGGLVLPWERYQEVTALAHREGVPVHLDGARLFNAEAASGIAASAWANHVDSVMVCLSKGLGCPMGSLLVGTRSFIDRARRVRQQLGGGMRQAGVVAACGLVALREEVPRLEQDHRNASRLREGLERNPLFDVPKVASSLTTNMVYFELRSDAGLDVEALLSRCAESALALSPVYGRALRMVCHRDVDEADVERALSVLQAIADER